MAAEKLNTMPKDDRFYRSYLPTRPTRTPGSQILWDNPGVIQLQPVAPPSPEPQTDAADVLTDTMNSVANGIENDIQFFFEAAKSARRHLSLVDPTAPVEPEVAESTPVTPERTEINFAERLAA